MRSVKVYRTMMDAWHAGVRDWCVQASSHAFDGGHAVCVVNHPGQMRWIKAQLLAEGCGAMGIQFLDLPRLRTEIARLAGRELHLLGAESLEFLLKIEIADAADNVLRSNLRPAMRALDELVAARGVEALEEADFLPNELRHFGSSLATTGYWAPAVDAALADSPLEPQTGLNVLMLGLDAQAFSNLRLVHALSKLAPSLHAFLPSPGITAEGLGQQWVDAVAHTLGCEWEICEDSGTSAIVNDRAAMFSGIEELSSSDTSVEAVIAENEALQSGLIVDALQRMLEGGHAASSHPVGILFPSRCLQAAVIKEKLIGQGFVVLDELRELPVMQPKPGVVQAMLQCIAADYDAKAFLTLVENLDRLQHPDWTVISPKSAFGWLDEGFVQCQSRDVRVILKAAAKVDARRRDPKVLERMVELIALLSNLPQQSKWAGFADAWKSLLQHFDLTVDLLEPLWSRIGEVAKERAIGIGDFLDYVAVMVDARPARVDPAANHGFAKIILTDFQKAGGRRWGGLLFAESHDGGWPTRPNENAFLPDEQKRELNRLSAGGIPLLTKSDLTALQDARLIDLVQNCEGPLFFSMSARDPAAPARERFPNAWMSLAGKIASGGLREVAGPVLSERTLSYDDPALVKLAHVHASRFDSSKGFGAWMFDLGLEEAGVRPWSATGLDRAIQFPATFALRQYMLAEPKYLTEKFDRAASLIQGTVTHRWMSALAKEAIAGGASFPVPDSAVALQCLRADFLASLRESFAPRADLPAWWLAVLERVIWHAERCLSLLEETLSTSSLHPEVTLQATVEPGANPKLELKGRVDLLISDEAELSNARFVRVVDFKTGGTEDALTLNNLSKGKGLQFAGYVAIAAALAPGADVTAVRILSESQKSDELRLNAAQIEELLAPLARLQRGRCFGQGASSAASEHTRVEVLPLACPPVPDGVLMAKQELALTGAG